jgi:prolipoprotein diacylglyceryltransferase
VRRPSPFQTCAGIGLTCGLTLAVVLTIHRGLSVHVTVVLACAGLLAFLAMTMITKLIVGEEILVYYHDEIAVLAAAAAVLYVAGLQVLPYLDISVLAVGTSLAFGRIGCFMVGCCHGRPSEWGVRYAHEHADEGFPRSLVGVRLFPVPLLESAWAFGTVAGGVRLVVAGAAPGEALAWYTTVYGLGRYCFEWLRGDAGRAYFKGSSEAQWTSCVLMSANAAAELAGLLPLHLWHVWLTASLAVTTLAVGCLDSREWRLLRSPHLLEIADVIEMARANAHVAGDIHVIRTSLGIQVSASDIEDGRRHVEVIAFSSCGGVLSAPAAQQLGHAIARVRGCHTRVEVISSDSGVYRLVVPSPRSTYAV